MEQTEARLENGYMLVLGFDAGCTTCSGLAARVAEAVGEHLEIRPLNDPQVENWRRRAFGKNAPWVPTLIEVKSTSVKAWTGVRMAVALSRRLGPAATWRVMQVLGDVHQTVQPSKSTAGPTASGISRTQFLKGLGGTAVALGVLTSTGNFASIALARSASQNGALEALKSVKTTDLTGQELIRVGRRVAQRRDIMNLMGQTWSTKIREGRVATTVEGGEQAIQMQNRASTHPVERTVSELDHIAVKAARHKLKNGATMLAVAYKLSRDNKVLVYYELDRPIPDGENWFKSQAILYKVEDDQAMFEGLSVDGGRERPQVRNTASTRFSCGGCFSSNCASRRRYCKSIKWGCLTVACVACIPACASLLGCLYCAVVQCPYSYFVACCRQVGYRCVGCRYCR